MRSPEDKANPVQRLARRQLTAALAALLAGCGAPRARHEPAASVPVASPPAPIAAPPLPPPSPPGAASRVQLDGRLREEAVARALLVVNTPYTRGGNTPEGGFDCSGLVSYVFARVAAAGAAATPRLPRSTAQWAAASAPVEPDRLQRGDLVFFNTSGAPWSHMGIYVGQNQFVHAPSTGGTVRKAGLGDRYFAPRYLGARTVFSA